MNSYWYIGSDNPVIVNGETSSFPNTTTGGNARFDFYIQESEIDNRGSGALYGEDYGAEYGGDYGTEYGGGLTYATASERYNRLKEYLRYAGYATTSKTLGSAYFSEYSDYEQSEIDSLLVPIYPHEDIDEARGVWGVITGGDDSTEVFGAIARVSLDVFVLAEYSEFETESDVRNEFEASI